jgi:hypothetical protein
MIKVISSQQIKTTHSLTHISEAQLIAPREHATGCNLEPLNYSRTESSEVCTW